MTRGAAWDPYLDTEVDSALVDRVRARVSVLAEIDQRHHALMTEFGHPGQSRSVYLRATGRTSWRVPIRVPPGCTDMEFALLCWGVGRIKITSPADSVGGAATVLQSEDESLADYAMLSGLLPDSLGADSGRSVTVLSAVSWDESNVDLTLEISNVDGVCGVLEIVAYPIWVPRS